MKLYLSSIRIPTPHDLAQLLGKPLNKSTVAFIPNAQDYYSERARDCKVKDCTDYFKSLGLNVAIVDLREYGDVTTLESKLVGHDLIWAMGGNTFCLRYEMKRSGFDGAIEDLLTEGIVFGGDSAGALVAGISIGGIESVDIPQFAEEVIEEGLNLVPFVVLPHVDNPEFAEVIPKVRKIYQDKHGLIELKDSQAVIFDKGKHWIVEAQK